MTTQWRYKMGGPPITFPGTRIALLDGGAAMFVPAQVTFEIDLDGDDKNEVVIDLVVDVEDGRPAVQEFTVRRVEGKPPLEFVARDVVRGVSLRDLLREVVVSRALERTEGGWRVVTTDQGLAAAVAGVRSRRLPMSDERLRLTAAAYRSGGIEAVMNLEGWQCERRQAQRAVKLARERGILTEGDMK